MSNRCHFCDDEIATEHQIDVPHEDREVVSCSQCAYGEPQKYFWTNVGQEAEIAQLREQNAKLQATIDRVRERVRWIPPKYGQHTNGPYYIFHGGYRRIIEDILDGTE